MGNHAQASLGLAADRRRLLRGGCRDERGGILLMFALFMTLFALLCAVVVDVGYWWVIGKKTQVAADACALAAAGELPQQWDAPPLNHCLIAGRDYAKTNLPREGLANEPRHMSTVVTTPYPRGSGDPATYVEAKVTVVVRTFFGRVVGLDYLTLERRAVAERSQGTGNYAIYSHTQDCPDGLQFNDNNHSINGRVHSNGEFLVNNGGAEPFWAAEGTAVTCTTLPPGQVRFGGTGWTPGGDSTPDIVPVQTWPEYFTPAQFGWPSCSGADFSGQKIEITGSELKVDGQSKPFPIVGGRRQIPPGTYCATELFTLSGSNIDGDITVLAPKIELSGDHNQFTPFSDKGVLFFQIPNTNTDPSDDGEQDGVPPPNCANAAEELKIGGNNGKWEGKIFHPCGRVLVNGDGWTSVGGAIYGKRVKIDGNDFNMVGTGGGDATKSVALVE